MRAFAGYFDAAGSESDSDVIVACGALSYADDWVAFDEVWQATMKVFGMGTFHMKDFAQFKPPYDVGWRGDEPRRKEFLGSLVRQTNESVYRIYVTTLVLSDYEAVNRVYQMTEHLANPYAWVMANCLFHTFDWVLGKHGEEPDPTCPVLPSEGVAFFVEKGDAGQVGLRRLMIAMGWTNEEFEQTIHFISKRNDEEDVTPFHVPDFIAYEYRSEHRYRVVNQEAKSKPRGALTAIRNELYPRVGIVTTDALRDACALNNVPRR